MAEQLGGVFIPEYAREYVERKGSTEVTFDELCILARQQIEVLEDERMIGAKDERVYIFDTELIITRVWFSEVFGCIPEWLDEAIKRYPMNLYLLCRPDIEWVADAARSNGEQTMREHLFGCYQRELETRGLPYYIIRH